MEIRLLAEPEYCEQLDLTVDEIIEQYLAGEFTGEELEQVRRYFFASEVRKEQLRFAIALEERKTRPAADQGSTTAVVTPLPVKKSTIAPYLALAAILLVAAGIGFVVWRALYSQSDLDRGLVAMNQAYREQRPVEARLSNLDYAPLPSQRGEESKVNYVQQELAARLLANAVADEPSPASHNALGQYYLTARQFDKAIEQFNAALALDPSDAKSHLNLGAAFLEKGKLELGKTDGRSINDFSQSVEHLNKGLELNNSLLEGYFNRALAYQYMMRSREAEAAWKEYLQKDSTSPWAEEARRHLLRSEISNLRS